MNLRIKLLVLFLAFCPQFLWAEGHNWMSQIQGQRPISTITLPGTHDAGALKEPARGIAATQTATIREQLQWGVRLLDIRCRHIEDRFDIHHGIVFQELTFDDVLREVFTFLKENPKECVVMSVNQEFIATDVTRRFEETFNEYLKANRKKWYLKKEIPSLDEVRGKIVLLRRFAGKSSGGIDASQWPGNQSFTKNGLTVQDCYRVKDSEKKWKQIEAAFLSAKQGRSGKMIHLNFASGVSSTRIGWPDIRIVSDSINPKLLAYFRKAKPGFYGWIMVDFVTKDMARMIYRTNF